jgi:hypothetical protein
VLQNFPAGISHGGTVQVLLCYYPWIYIAAATFLAGMPAALASFGLLILIAVIEHDFTVLLRFMPKYKK